ncbi:ABC transporter permease [Actinomyces viscosus]|uniref:ABC transporter permease n=1 Tax=Actinomyces viscosus TaxID=1656 RepID=UPI0028F0BB88|nr:ABC transporter permease [Actinomyces viscosus]
MTGIALSSVPPISQSAQSPAVVGGAGGRASGQAGPAPAAAAPTSERSSRGSARPGFLTSVGVEVLKMRRLRVLLVTALLVIASVALSSINLFSQSTIQSFDNPAAKPWAMLLLGTAFFNAMTGSVFAAVLASRQTDIEHSGAGWNLAATSGLTPGALCRVKLAALALVIVPAVVIQNTALVVFARIMGISVPLDVSPWVTYTVLLISVDLAMCALHLWLATVVENQLVVVSAGLLGGFVGAFMLLAPPALARLLPWGYYAVIIPAKFVTSGGEAAGYEYINPPLAWVAGFLVLTALAFAVATHRLDRIER